MEYNSEKQDQEEIELSPQTEAMRTAVKFYEVIKRKKLIQWSITILKYGFLFIA